MVNRMTHLAARRTAHCVDTQPACLYGDGLRPLERPSRKILR